MFEKFDECVFVEKSRNTFLEYGDIDELMGDFGELYLNEVIGYFPKHSNITFEEFDKIKEDSTWIVAYHEKIDDSDVMSSQKIVVFNSTFDLKRNLESIFHKTFRNDKDYVTLYKASDLIYL